MNCIDRLKLYASSGAEAPNARRARCPAESEGQKRLPIEATFVLKVCVPPAEEDVVKKLNSALEAQPSTSYDAIPSFHTAVLHDAAVFS